MRLSALAQPCGRRERWRMVSLYVCSICTGCRPTRKNNIEQHVWCVVNLYDGLGVWAVLNAGWAGGPLHGFNQCQKVMITVAGVLRTPDLSTCLVTAYLCVVVICTRTRVPRSRLNMRENDIRQMHSEAHGQPSMDEHSRPIKYRAAAHKQYVERCVVGKSGCVRE